MMQLSQRRRQLQDQPHPLPHYRMDTPAPAAPPQLLVPQEERDWLLSLSIADVLLCPAQTLRRVPHSCEQVYADTVVMVLKRVRCDRLPHTG